MPFRLLFSDEARGVLGQLTQDASQTRKLKKIQKTLGLLETDPRHPGLRVHPFRSLAGPSGTQLWEAYVENRTPGAWRIWFAYGPERGEITILAIGPHPD